MSMGSMARGNRSTLKREMEVKAFSAVSTLFSLTPTNTANVAKDTCKTKPVNGGEQGLADGGHQICCVFAGGFCRLTRAGAQLKMKVETDVRYAKFLMTFSSSSLICSTCVWKDGSHAYSFKIWWEPKDKGAKGIVEHKKGRVGEQSIHVL